MTTTTLPADVWATDAWATDTPATASTPPSLADRLASEEGATTAEYGITVLAACAFAALLFGILTSGPVRELVLGLITRALGSAG